MPPLAFAGDSESIKIPLEFNKKGEDLITLHKDDKVFVPQQSWTKQHIAMQLPEDLHMPGFYDVFLGDLHVSTIAINIPVSESNLETYSKDELKDIFSNSKFPVDFIAVDSGQSFEKALEKETKDTDLAKYCLILCLLLLLVEIFILRKRASGSPT
ncbi:hypothetical protein GCM10023183_37520 [Nibribacter koreensis]|uniref:Uncharacterized protein n=2 Tax=Nibribacter koreensis TaxID=1084519 RepID=A0ABP8G376_9BACT